MTARMRARQFRVFVGLAFLGIAAAALMGTSAYRRASRTSCLGLDVDPFVAKVGGVRRAAELDLAPQGEVDVPAVVAGPEEDAANAIVIERAAVKTLGTPSFVTQLGVDQGCLDAAARVADDPSLCQRGVAPAAFSGRCRDFVSRRLRYAVIVDGTRAKLIDLETNKTKRTGEHPLSGVRFVRQ